ncbi:xanthine dehydrogenase family protein molybdopterin-binding subunit [Niallia sp. Krafla_26]|uniref:xanthine dehydrogenase family protein molybdopterin-binding subunit n=1 Tax=Niallia sp. Krafla_26 TaxID=3064703 RepID=UPI003D17E543
MKKYIGQNIQRKEDYRLVTGKGLFVGDIYLDGMLEATFVRSPQAHALIKKIDITKAKELEGVVDILTGQDIKGIIKPIGQFDAHCAVPPNVGEAINAQIQYNYEDVLAIDKVIYVGQPVAVVIAENRYIAEDAADLIQVTYEQLPVIVNPFKAMEEGAPLVHENIKKNIQMQFHVKTGQPTHEVEKQADHVLKTRVSTPRLGSNPIETKGVVAEYDGRTNQMQVWSATQLPFEVRATISHCLRWTEQSIRVIAPDVGGGFGPKGGVHPEEIIVPYLSKKHNRPVKWIEDRLEHLTSARQSRDQVHDVVVAFQNDGTITSLRDEFILDAGAVNFFGFTCAYNTAYHLRGAYKIPNYDIKARIVLTNKTPNVPFRGAGRPEAVFTMDRIIDMVARKLKMDPLEVMKKNMIQAHEMPYDQGIFVKDGAQLIYDSGNYPEALDKALKMVDYEGFRARQAEAKRQGKYIGVGISSYVEGTGAGPFEGAHLSVDSTGKVIAHLGASPQGQGHETVFAQIGADALGLTPDDVIIRVGDTSVLPFGAGTYASRSTVNAGNAMHEGALKLRKKVETVACLMLGVSPEDIIMEDGKIFSKQSSEKVLTWVDIFNRTRPAARPPLPVEIEPGLQVTHYFVPPTTTFASSIHVAEVEVDKETGKVDIREYTCIHDCGVPVNPMIVDGQVQGGIAQGIGSALYEEIVYDEKGQLLTGSYMDYLLPTAMEIPSVKKGHQVYPSTRNSLGVKGVGEGGAIAPPAAVTNAIVDALAHLEIEINQLPVSPSRLRRLIKEAEEKQHSSTLG